MAVATKQTENVPVKFEEKLKSVTLTMSAEEATELRAVISDFHVSAAFKHIKNIREALTAAGVTYTIL